MPKYVTIGYGDQAGYDRTSEGVRNAAHDHDMTLVERGAVTGMAGSPVQVRNHDDNGISVREGAFLTAGFPVAGFALLEADSLQEAIALVAKTPCAVAQGVVEVWPLDDGS